jgi:hypothetical protein
MLLIRWFRYLWIFKGKLIIYLCYVINEVELSVTKGFTVYTFSPYPDMSWTGLFSWDRPQTESSLRRIVQNFLSFFLDVLVGNRTCRVVSCCSWSETDGYISDEWVSSNNLKWGFAYCYWKLCHLVVGSVCILYYLFYPSVRKSWH